jgi:uracil-DNA glycosylase
MPSAETEAALARLAAEARACRRCEGELPLGPRPIFRVGAGARLLIIGQAPGRRVHESGIPFDDASGKRLRAWLGLSPEVFYDSTRVALLPVGLCYPGRLPGGGDAPPRPVCAPLWHPRFRPLLPAVRLTLLVGGYAQAFVLGRGGSVTARVREFRAFWPEIVPLPHPSWRTTAWERRNPWFTAELLPLLRARIAEVLA